MISNPFFELLRERNIPFAMYRLPHTGQVRLMIQYRSHPITLNELEELPAATGFLVTPFDVTQDHKIVLLQPDLVCSPEEGMLLVGDIIRRCDRFMNIQPPTNSLVTTSKEDYISQVSHAIETIRVGELSKVILSRNKVLPHPEHFVPEHFFDRLCQQYTHAMVYYWQLPGVGSWIGATPEPLLQEQKGSISTVSLAGTQLYRGQSKDAVCWHEKEIAEQAIVSRYILQLLNKMGVESIEITGPQNFIAGNLVHLSTGFRFFSDNLRVPLARFVNTLHPTPSIAGWPREKSLAFIRQTETFRRGYYCGIFGPLSFERETHLFVNLRCMQLFSNELVLYSGAGITENSNPEKEWVETHNKMMTLLNVMYV